MEVTFNCKQIWLSAPWPAWLVAPVAGLFTAQANAAAGRWAVDQGVSLHDLEAWVLAAANQTHNTGAETTRMKPPGLAFVVNQIVGEGTLVWLQPQATPSQPWPLPPHAPRTGQYMAACDRFALNVAGVGIWERDIHGQVRYWNENMYALRGCSATDPRTPNEIIAQTTHPDDLQALHDAYKKHAASGLSYRADVRLQLPNGQARWLLSQGEPLRDAKGQLVGMTGINLDVTESKQAQAQLAKAQRAAQANQEKSSFMALMSHQLRTPLNAVLGFSRLIREDQQEPLNAKHASHLAHIEEAGQRLLGLTDHLLETLLREDQRLATTWQHENPDQCLASKTTGLGTDLGLDQHRVAPSAAAPMNVLYVEDNPVNRLLVQEILALRPGVRLRCAPDGLTGVAMALADPPDLVLLDMQLPDISGLEVHHRLRQHPHLARCRVIALSADLLPESQSTARAAGLDDYWTKPIQFDRFLSRMDLLAVQFRLDSQTSPDSAPATRTAATFFPSMT